MYEGGSRQTPSRTLGGTRASRNRRIFGQPLSAAAAMQRVVILAPARPLRTVAAASPNRRSYLPAAISTSATSRCPHATAFSRGDSRPNGPRDGTRSSSLTTLGSGGRSWGRLWRTAERCAVPPTCPRTQKHAYQRHDSLLTRVRKDGADLASVVRDRAGLA